MGLCRELRRLLLPQGGRGDRRWPLINWIRNKVTSRALLPCAWPRRGPIFLSVIAIATVCFFIYALNELCVGDRHLTVDRPNILKQPSSGNDGSGRGNLRIVVFGSSGGLASPDKGKTAKKSNNIQQQQSWTDILCQQLECNSYISLVPENKTSHTVGGSIISNELYDTCLHSLSGISNHGDDQDKDKTESNQSPWQMKSYPVPHETPDLLTQIENYFSSPFSSLTTPKQEKEEEEEAEHILLVFDFGYWDIWNLSALPNRPRIAAMVDEQVDHLFRAIELLYLDEAQMIRNRRRSSRGSRGRLHHDENHQNKDVMDNENGTTVQEKEREKGKKPNPKPKPKFQIIIPTLLDISLTPGWSSPKLRRTEPPIIVDDPSSFSSSSSSSSSSSGRNKAEQMRNAAMATRRWNEAVRNKTEEWAMALVGEEEEEEKEDFESNDDDDSDDLYEEGIGRLGWSHGEIRDEEGWGRGRQQGGGLLSLLIEEEESSIRDQNQNQKQQKQQQKEKKEKPPPPPPSWFPERSAFIFDMESYIRGIMVDSWQLRNGYHGHHHHHHDNNNGLGLGGEETGEESFFEVWEPCFVDDDDDDDDQWGEEKEKEKEKDEEDEEGETTTCLAPHEHLFWTEFTVNPRAITQIGKKAAEEIKGAWADGRF